MTETGDERSTADEAEVDAASSPPGPSVTDERRASAWGAPAFARSFPRDPALDRLVDAFTRGDYHTVRSGAAELAVGASDDVVRSAAKTLLERTKPDPSARVFYAVTAALLVALSVYWITHDGPAGPQRSRPTSAATPAR